MIIHRDIRGCITDLYHGNDPVTDSGNVPTCRSCDNICEMTTATIFRLNISWTTSLQSKYFCSGLSCRGAILLSTCWSRLPIVGVIGGMIRSWNLYQLYFLVSGHQLKQKKYKSPVFSQSVIINFGHNYSVIFVTRGPGGDDSQWPGDDQRHDDDGDISCTTRVWDTATH